MSEAILIPGGVVMEEVCEGGCNFGMMGDKLDGVAAKPKKELRYLKLEGCGQS